LSAKGHAEALEACVLGIANYALMVMHGVKASAHTLRVPQCDLYSQSQPALFWCCHQQIEIHLEIYIFKHQTYYMKNLFLFALFLTIAYSTKAQKLTEYTAINGITYKIGDTVHLGMGSSAKGTFMFLQMSGWAASLNYDPNAGPDQLNIGRGYDNTAVIVKKITASKIKGIIKYSFTVGGGNITNYVLYIDDAIQVCEVVPCQQSGPPTPTTEPDDDKVTRLKKWKALLDDGTITQDEYEAQKKKILGE
jgi:hypothetical protein